MDTAPTLLTAEEVGHRLGLSSKSVRRLATAGNLPSVRLGDRMLRFDPDDVEAFIAARKSEPSEPQAS